MNFPINIISEIKNALNKLYPILPPNDILPKPLKL